MVVNQQRRLQADWETKLALILEKQLEDRLAAKQERETEKGAKKGLSRKEMFAVIVSVLTRYTTIGVVDPIYRSDDINTLDLIKIYNPISLIWESPRFIIKNLLFAAIGNYSSTDFQGCVNFIYGSLVNNPSGTTYVPDPYDGARYLMFDNGIYDTCTKQLIKIKPQTITAKIKSGKKIKVPIVKYNPTLEIDGEDIPLPEVGFNEFHKHHRNFRFFDRDSIPKFDGDPLPGQANYDFTPLEWIRRVAGGIPQANFILQNMGALLVPNHRFNAFWEINGPSNSGKSTLINLVKAGYNSRESVLDGFTIDTLTESFPFRGTVNETTNVVSITEVNGSSVPKAAISFVNQFANEAVSLKQLGGKSKTISPPPMLILEGAGWAHFDVTNTGVQRRIIPINLGESSAKNYRAKLKKNVFRRKDFIDCFVFLAVTAYAEMTQGDDNFVFQIDNLNTLPDFAQLWHTQAISAGDRYMNNYMARLAPALHTGYLPLQIMHQLYQISTKLDGIENQYQRRMPSFITAFVIYLRQSGYNVIQYDTDKQDQLQKHSEDELGIDFEKVQEAMDIPDDLKNYNSSEFNRFKRPQWIKIERK